MTDELERPVPCAWCRRAHPEGSIAPNATVNVWIAPALLRLPACARHARLVEGRTGWTATPRRTAPQGPKLTLVRGPEPELDTPT